MNYRCNFIGFIFLIFSSLFLQQTRAQLFDGNVWVNGSNGNIVRVSNILTNPTEYVICTSNVMGDIGFSPDGKLYGASMAWSSLNIIDTVTGSDTILFLISIPRPNALSFDEKGRAYLGSSIESKVVRVDLNTNPITTNLWHDFGNGIASGDFIFMNHKVYVAWYVEKPNYAAEYLYEVTIDADNNYISHVSLGELPTFTWGLASDGKNTIFSVSSDNKIYSIIPPASPVGILTTTLLYTCTQTSDAYGASSKAEALGNAELDYGDAAIPFPTYDSLSGALHRIVSGMCLGSSVDKDVDGQPTPDATGDDNDAEGNDDNGILLNGTGFQNATLVSGSSLQLEVTCKGTGRLNAWIDWNIDGDWSDDNEHIISDTLLNNGLHFIPLKIPQTIAQGVSFSRFRFSTQSDMSFQGFAPDGEVEDYMVNLVKCTSTVSLNPDSLERVPTTCGGNTGAITGLEAEGIQPLTYEWKNQTGDIVGTTLNVYHLGVGYYSLNITDAYGCSDSVCTYSIVDVGNILIDTAVVTPAYCGNSDGTLTITAVSGLGSMLQYFIETGNDTLSQWSNGNFTGLAGGNYNVWVTDSSGCNSLYTNVLQIGEFTAPEIITATSTPETGIAANGTITVNALGTGLSYSLNGATPVNTGHFTGLSAGDYSITVTNPAGCDTTFTLTVAHETGIVLSAIAGNGFACLGKEAKAPIVVKKFKDVQSFETILNYDPLFVTCLGYNNPNPLLVDSIKVTIPASGKILTRWNGTTPLTLPDSTEMVQLVFSSLLPGNALLLWDISPAISNFFGPGGDTLNVDYTLGTILVSNPPQILPDPKQTDCEGGLLMVWRTVENGTGPLSYQWQTPTGTSSQEIIIKTATLADNGLYSLIVTDTLQCADTSTKMVTVVPTPVSGFPTDSDTLYFDERRWLEAAQGYDTYSWNTGDTTYSILVTTEGWYKVTIATPEGCTTTDSVMMLYAFVPLTMPNAFTPDGDGLNDYFKPVTLPEKISSFSMYIYDRWGMQVFFTNDVKQGWDGNINGSPAQIGGYVYVLKYGNPSGAEREKRGMVTLVR